ncbi:hypothetical protein HPB51_029442 [Rhipicephalus microplus]|uniref:Trans-golgi network protein 2 n=1 Tax=Rhipicephalus microplus TaxID=6941 RepID=A0A9J6CU12_RHIMP|nr:hypothetical protein HPB51_029442 [Rhipicephalus microplus]
MVQLQESSLERATAKVGQFEQKPAIHVSNCANVSDPKRTISEGGVSAGGPVLQHEHQCSVMLSPMTVVVNLNESISPPSSGGSMKSSNGDKDDQVNGPPRRVKDDDQNAATNSQVENNVKAPVGGSQPPVTTKVEETPPPITPTQTSTLQKKFQPTEPPQSQGQQKDVDASSGRLKDLGEIPSASNPGNFEYGNAREPDSEEELEPPLPTQKGLASVTSGSASSGAQSIVGSMGGSHPEKPLDASGAAGSMPSLPSQDDSHFFAYFLAAVVLCVIGYLAFHNKRKILALILEGRHERQRRHNGHYRRLDNTDEALSARKNRGSF